MAEQKMSDTLFEAMDIIINKRIEAVGKDKTILCVVEDNSKAEQGEYTVSNTSTKFTAYSENPKYTVGQNVWVLIPEGDYNKEKKILGKHVGSSNTPYIYVDPLASYVDMTGNVLHDAQQFSGENGLIANYSHPVDIFTGEPVSTPGLIWDNAQQKWAADVFTIDNLLLNNAGLGLEHFNHKQFPDYDCVGISADFSTNFGTNIPISGTYGLRFELIIAVPAEQVKSGEDETDLATYYNFVSFPITLDSTNMWGNPYNYATPTTQTIRYKLPLDAGGNVLGIPIGIHGYFYQNFDFKDQNNGEYPFYSAVEFNGSEPVYTSQQRPDLASPNIFVKDICVSFGYAVEKVEDDTLFLFTTSSDTYIVDNDDYDKKLQVRYVYADDNQTKIAINSWSDLNGRIQEIPELKALAPVIHWYRYKLIEGVQDLRAGNLWEEFYPRDMFFTTIDNWENIAEEKFKCILCYNNKFAYYIRSYVEALRREGKTGTPHYNHYFSLWEWWYGTICGANSADRDFDEKFPYNTDATSDDIWEQWCKTDQRIESKELVFTNKANAYDSTQDFIQGLRLEAADRSNGVFNIYEATYGANNNLINSSDEYIARKIKATFWSAVTKEDEMNKVERLAWYVPKHNTMIKKPEDGSSYGAYTKIELTADTYKPGIYYTRNLTTYTLSNDSFDSEATYYEKGQEKFFATEEDLNDAIANEEVDLSEEEINLFKTRLLSYYIVLEDDIQETAEKINEATLVYYIKPELKKHWTNNTILASAYRYHRIYEGEKAKFTPIFGAKGTNGTDYTLSLQMVSDIGANGVEYQNPPAWTWNPSNTNGGNTIIGDATASMQLNAQLFDADDVEVTTATYTWSFLFPENGKINNDTIWTWGESGSNVQNPVLLPSSLFNNYSSTPMTIGHYEGVILKCEARLTNETFTGYLIVPMRRSRAYIGIQGPSIIRYSSSGTGAQYYDAPYGLLDIDENILYTNNGVENKVTLVTFNDNDDNGAKVSNYANKYLPNVAKKSTDDHYHLYPKAMFFNNVVYRAFIKIHRGDSTSFLWGQPLLVVVDPYGNTFLNNWGGGLDIDYDNNTIMSAVMGAGKKETDNSFTGLLLGNLPEVTQEGVDNQGHPIMVDKTGLVGYEHGEQAYGIFDDGTMFLGKASTAQLKFDGNDGYIQNAGYGPRGYGIGDNSAEPDTNGIRINFSGATKGATPVASMGNPYIHIRKAGQAEIVLNSGGPGPYDAWSDQYVKIRGAEAKDLLHIAANSYYLQTANYSDNDKTGLRIDLKNGVLKGYDNLTLQGGTLGQNNSMYLSTNDAPIAASSDPAIIIAGQSNKTNWRLTMGSNFGVDANGNMFATNGNLTGKITANEGTIGGFNITTVADLATHVFPNSLYVHTTANGYDYEAGLSKAVNATDLMFYVKRKASSTNTWNNATDMFFVKANGSMKATAGTIGGWTIGDSSLYSGNTHLYSNGSIKGATIYGSTIQGSSIYITGYTDADDNTYTGTLSFGGGRSIQAYTTTIDGTGYTTFKFSHGIDVTGMGKFSGNVSGSNITATNIVSANNIQINRTNGAGGNPLYLSNINGTLYAGENKSTADTYVVRSSLVSQWTQQNSSAYNIYADGNGLYYTSNGAKTYVHLRVLMNGLTVVATN